MKRNNEIHAARGRQRARAVGTGTLPLEGLVGSVAMAALMIYGASAHAEGDAAAGKTVFANQCASCHTAEVGKNGFGPSLARVVGRKAGGLSGFSYSPAMAQAGLTWDEKTLDTFLTSSTNAVPGTSMSVALPSAADR